MNSIQEKKPIKETQPLLSVYKTDSSPYWKIQTWNRTDGSITVTCSKATSKETAISVANEFYVQQMNDIKFDVKDELENLDEHSDHRCDFPF